MAQGRIDFHFHSMSPAYRAAIGSLSPTIRTPDWTPELAIGFMDRQGLGAGILSLSVPGTHLGNDAQGRFLAKRCNEESAEYIGRYPKRLGAFATLPLPDIDSACEAALYALDILKLDGIGFFGNYEGIYLGDPRWDALLRILNERSAVCLVHPNNNPVNITIREGISRGIPNFLAEYLYDTTRAALNLLFFDILDRFSNIHFILCHAGGTLPYFAWRVAEIATHQVAVSPFDKQYPSPFMTRHEGKVDQELIFSQLRRFWYDTALSAGPQTFGSLLQVADPERILFGSDWPYCPENMAEDMIHALDSNPLLNKTQLAAIERGNALRLFPRFAGS
jgi:predicted TIM-barrel fold metal-dependent hydrolase